MTLREKLEAWADELEKREYTDGDWDMFQRDAHDMLALLWPVISAAADDPIMSEEVKDALAKLEQELK